MNFKLFIFFSLLIGYCEPNHELECKALIHRINISYKYQAADKNRMPMWMQYDEFRCIHYEAQLDLPKTRANHKHEQTNLPQKP